MKTYTDEERETALKIYSWLRNKVTMEKYGRQIKRSRYTTLMKIFKESGTYTRTKGGAYYIYFKLRDIGLSPSYRFCVFLLFSSLILPVALIFIGVYFFKGNF